MGVFGCKSIQDAYACLQHCWIAADHIMHMEVIGVSHSSLLALEIPLAADPRMFITGDLLRNDHRRCLFVTILDVT